MAIFLQDLPVTVKLNCTTGQKKEEKENKTSVKKSQEDLQVKIMSNRKALNKKKATHITKSLRVRGNPSDSLQRSFSSVYLDRVYMPPSYGNRHNRIQPAVLRLQRVMSFLLPFTSIFLVLNSC